MSRVGFIGVGVMGAPMARNLLKAGHRVRAFDASPAALAAVVRDGAGEAGSAREAADGAEYVITMLPTGQHVAEAVLGSEGLAEALDPAALLIDMSTGLPAHFDATAETLAASGRRMIDAPVGRTSKDAEAGTLLVMAGGSPEEVERALPILEILGDPVIHCGPRGAGIRTKLVNNYVSVVSNVVVAEALTLAEGEGLDRDLVIEVLMGTTAGQGHLATTYPAKVLAGDLEPGFMIDLAHKDLGLAIGMGEAAGVAHGTGSAARECYAAAQDQGMGRLDWTVIYNFLRRSAGS
jgi:4-hydroxybutyrate dehydrogenase/sulfolactaldehyde 3-reductase